MFAAFFYLLRQRGLHVSLNEWMTLCQMPATVRCPVTVH